MKKFKRVVAISDMHCGHRVGLTPPKYNQKAIHETDFCWDDQRRKQWKWFEKKIEHLRRKHPLDRLFVVGDAVEGPGVKAKGRDVIWPQREDQIAMAKDTIEFIDAEQTFMVVGTQYHVDNDERAVAEAVGAPIKSQDWIGVNGIVFSLKHHIGSSSVPHGGHTPLAKTQLWNALHAEIAEDQPRTDVFLRAHVHEHKVISGVGKKGMWYACTMPALQGPGSIFGLERCEKIVHFGFLHFDVYENGHYEAQAHIAKLDCHKAEVTET